MAPNDFITGDDTDPREEAIYDLLEDTAVDPDQVEICQWEMSMDVDPIHSWNGHAGWEGQQTKTITCYDTENPGTLITVETDHPIVITNPSDDEEETPEKLYLAAEDDWDDAACLECGREFHTDTWEQTSQGGDAWGGQANYDCPEPECDGRASVQY